MPGAYLDMAIFIDSFASGSRKDPAVTTIYGRLLDPGSAQHFGKKYLNI